MSNKYLTSITLPNGETAGVGIPIFGTVEEFRSIAQSGQIGMVGRNRTYLPNLKDIPAITQKNLDSNFEDLKYVFNFIHPTFHDSKPNFNWEMTVFFSEPAIQYYNQFQTPLPVPSFILKAQDGTLSGTFYDPDLTLEDYGEYGVTENDLVIGKYVFIDAVDGLQHNAISSFEQLLESREYPQCYIFEDETNNLWREDNQYLFFEYDAIPYKFYQKGQPNEVEIFPLSGIVSNSKENLPTNVPYHLPLGSKATVYTKEVELKPTEVNGVTEKEVADYSIFIGNGGNAEDYKWDYDNIVNLQLNTSNLPTLNSDLNCMFTIYFMTPNDLMTGAGVIKYAMVQIEGADVYAIVYDTSKPTEEEQIWSKVICTGGSWDYDLIREFNDKVKSLNATTGMLIDDGSDLSAFDEFVVVSAGKEVCTDYRLLSSGWVKDSIESIDTSAIEAKIQANTDKIESLQTDVDANATAIDELQTKTDVHTTAIDELQKDVDANATAIDELQKDVDEVFPQVVDSVDELTNLELPVGSIVSVKSYTKTYDRKTINPLTSTETINELFDGNYANPIESYHYTTFNSVELSSKYYSGNTWEIVIYFSDAKQAAFYNIEETEWAKPVPTLILSKSGGPSVSVKFFDPDLTIDDYGEYGVEEDGSIFAKATITYNATAAAFLTNLINSRNYKTGFVYTEDESYLNNFRNSGGDVIKFIKKGLIVDFRKIESEDGSVIWEEIPNLNVIDSLLSKNTIDVNNITSKLLSTETKIKSNTTAIEQVNAKLDDFLPADYLIQMAQADGRLMCHDEYMGSVDVLTSTGEYTTFNTRGGGCVLTQPIQAVWSTSHSPDGYSGPFASNNYIDAIYSLPAPYYSEDGTVSASGLFAGLSNLKRLDYDALSNYVAKITGAAKMFYNCKYLRPLTLNYDFPNLTSVHEMFCGACTVNAGYDSNAHIKITGEFTVLQNAAWMFYDCAPMTIDLSQANMPMVETADRMFYAGSTYGNPATIALPTTMPKIVSMYEMFYNSYVNTISSGLQTCQNVTAITNAFYGCTTLANLPTGFLGGLKISVSFAHSKNLTRESILNVINAVADLSAEGTTATLTLHATAKARLTEDDIAIATAKGWTIA